MTAVHRGRRRRSGVPRTMRERLNARVFGSSGGTLRRYERLVRRYVNLTLLFAQFSRMAYGSDTSKKTPMNCQRDQWCSTDHQIKNPAPRRMTTQFVKWIGTENHGQLPVRRLYEVHQATVFLPSATVFLIVLSIC